jgi:hypothetical protein
MAMVGRRGAEIRKEKYTKGRGKRQLRLFGACDIGAYLADVETFPSGYIREAIP